MNGAKTDKGTDLTWYPLDKQVLVVLSVNLLVGDWSAYIGAVPGQRHSQEWQAVASHGTRLYRKAAEALFEGHLEALNAERATEGLGKLRWRG